MAYSSWSVVFGEQPSAAKWNILGTNDAHFYTYTGEGTNAVQQRVYNQTGAVSTTTTAMPFDDTIPQSGEGAQFMTQAITPKSATNILEIELTALLGCNPADRAIMALFQDSTASALAATSTYITSSGGEASVYLKHTMVAGTTSSTTFKMRAGESAGATLTFNGAGGARKFGGVAASSMVITEYKV